MIHAGLNLSIWPSAWLERIRDSRCDTCHTLDLTAHIKRLWTCCRRGHPPSSSITTPTTSSSCLPDPAFVEISSTSTLVRHCLLFCSDTDARPGESALTALCHCHACQKWSGSTASSNVLLKKDQFKLVKGTPKVFTMPGDSGKSKFRNFCANCGSCLFGELEILPGMIGLKAG